MRNGFETFIDCSDDTSCFTTLLNEDHPFSSLIEGRTGIKDRKLANPSVNIAQISEIAIKRIFDELHISGKDCEGLVLSSSNPEYESGGIEKVANELSNKFEIPQVQTVNYACSGFPAAVQAAMEMDNPSKRHILVITAEILSQLVDWDDKNTALVFGDGVAITSMIPNGKHRIIDAWARGNITDPKKCLRMQKKTGTEMIQVCSADEAESSGKLFKTTSDHKERDIVIMDGGRYLFKNVPQSLVEQVMHSRVGIEGVSRIVPHQANGRFIELMNDAIEKLYRERKIPITNTIAHQANSASASIPRALAKTIHTFDKGEVVACPAKGAGMYYEEGKLTEGIVLFEVGK